MAILKNGGDATEAVEMCIRVLEDREITNAGYGSNLNMNGHVECDATMVDHLGRSGAIGAASHIKNPITLAHIVLKASTRPLSLSRVPPNLIVGDGAADFAHENGVSVVPHDFLISDEARKRWTKWKTDLANVAANGGGPDNASDMASKSRTASIDSNVRTPPHAEVNPLGAIPTPTRPLAASAVDLPSEAMNANAGHTPHHTKFRSSQTYGSTHDHDQEHYLYEDEATDLDFGNLSPSMSPTMSPIAKRAKLSSSMDGSDTDQGLMMHSMNLSSDRKSDKVVRLQYLTEEDGDNIVDTVGAIAVDAWGNIAGGSSSGGIGMKHKGRCGPAALVGVGTAVIPRDEGDLTMSSVATVVSGTGEHMATTMAAASAAERIYYSHRRVNGSYEDCTEDEALEGMINNEFINHPGVRHSPCTGAIGILGVKKSKDGIYFYFAHNTDSFAIASMHSEERKPVCVMSRNNKSGSLAQGGRLCRSKYARK
ncbi:putative threonine aspartase [Cyphellophora attinorum]|uniref:Putative threonine aspartase n=1 Tax=Cyphellophora attinorum TaxID=1664694 RepID=A0A0N1NVX7_9EURO|nr:putative threonine aspartase [Phialophora attinorum]KPI35565.1 putative threonine aspartase [Phialophora attinorum]